MKKQIMSHALTFVFILLLVGCTTEGKEELTRIDVFLEKQNEIHIQDKDTLLAIESVFGQINWDNKVVNMVRKADLKAIFFYEVKENMPERIYEYEIWFNENEDIAVIVDENKSYGELDKENAKVLKSKLLN